MFVRPELAADLGAVDEVVAAAFAAGAAAGSPAAGRPGEVDLLLSLRSDPAWVDELALVAATTEGVVGHVLGTRAHVGERPAIALGPLAVHPDHQRRGIGSALVRRVLEIADDGTFPLVGVLGEPRYYARFGFVPGSQLGVVPPVETWGHHFQVKPLQAYDAECRGTFRYAAAFEVG